MKRFFLSLPLMMTIGLTTVFANDSTSVNSKIKETFEKEFRGAVSVRWREVEEVQMAMFDFHNQRVIAYFANDGELLGSARNIQFDQLPVAIQKSMDKNFPSADFITINEIFNPEGTYYWLTFEERNKHYHVKTSSNGTFLQVVRTKNKPARQRHADLAGGDKPA